MSDAALDDRVQALYGLTLGEFTAARDRLASELKKGGAAADAKVVKALTKPTRTAWITNQAVRRAPALMKELVLATQAIAAAQRAVAPGGGAQSRFQDARAEQRRIIALVLEGARHALADGAMPVDEAALERVEKNLAWGAISDEERPLLLGGRLVRDVAAPGFTALAGLAAPEARGAAAPATAPAPRKPATDANASRPSRDDQEARRAEERRAAAAQAELKRVRAETARARRGVEQAESAWTAARHRVEAVEEQLDAARAELSVLESAHQDAVTTLHEREAEERTVEKRAAHSGAGDQHR